MSILSEIIKYNGIKSIIIIFFLSLIKNYKCGEDTNIKKINNRFPNCIELNNNNVLIIFENGIYLYNSEISEELSKTEYETDFSLGQSDLNLINLSKFDDGVVICIIKTYIYLFSPTGEYIYHSNLYNISGATYYSLIPHKIEDKNYYFAICYKKTSTELNIFYYKINISDKSINEVYVLNYIHEDSSYTFHNNIGVSCQLLSPLNSKNVLTCFYEVEGSNGASNALTASSFIIESTISRDDSIPFNYMVNDAGGLFKSAVNTDKTKVLICYSPNYNGGNCIFYNIINNTFTQDKKYFSSCQDTVKQLNVEFFTKTKEFIFSCAIGIKLTILKFDENGNAINLNVTPINTNYEFSKGNNFYCYSILFLSNNTQYSILYTTTNEYCYNEFLPETFNPSYIINTNEESNKDSETVTKTSIQESNIKSTNIQISYETVLQAKTSTHIHTSSILESEESTIINSLTITSNIENVNDYEECSSFENGNIKCLYCNEESLKIDKCIECNNNKGYYPINYNDKDDIYKQCYNEKTKLNNFYFDLKEKSFKLCYDLCNTCDNGGNGIENNCTSCIDGYILKPDTIIPTNCVIKCKYYFYYSSFGQYRCTDNGQCPLDNNLLIRPKSKCINNCSIDYSIYIYQYNSECLAICPDNTIPNEFNICEDQNINSCTLSVFNSDLNLNEIKTTNIELSASNYAKEYSYTDNHISQFNNELYSYILFKNTECIDELSLNFSTIDLGSCYNKIQSHYNITDNLIISIMNIKMDENKPVTLYEVFHPKTGNKINIENICENQNIIIKESIFNYLKSSKDFITEQNIDIFNISGSFYSDICYHFESPNGKDVPLKDRILSFYPNISLCDDGCNYKGFSLETYKTECECTVNNFVDNYLLINELPFSDTIIGDAINLIKESNILVLQCYKDLLDFNYYKYNKGTYIISSFIIIQIICTAIFLYKDLFNIKKYIYNLMENYILYVHQKNNKMIFNPPKSNKAKTSKIIIKPQKVIIQNDIIINKTNKSINCDSISKNSFSNGKKKTNIHFLSNNKNNILHTKNKFNKEKMINSRNKINNNSKNISNEDINLKEFLTTSLDDLDYDEAIERDKRNFCQKFIDLIKDEHMIVRTFVSDNIKPRSVKIVLFVLIINLYFVINALMYNEGFISEIYNSTEKENFFYFLNNSIGRLLSVSVIGIVISYFIEYFFIDEKKLKRIFLRNQKKKEIKYKTAVLIHNMNRKFKSFIVVNFLIIIFSWYYIFCFNNVYPNTSLNWIKSSIFLIIILQLISFVYIFFECVLRHISFVCESEAIFKISKILSD